VFAFFETIRRVCENEQYPRMSLIDRVMRAGATHHERETVLLIAVPLESPSDLVKSLYKANIAKGTHRSTEWIGRTRPAPVEIEAKSQDRTERTKMRSPLFVSMLSLMVAGTIATAALAAPSLRDEVKDQFAPIPAAPPALPNNPATPAKLALGKMLYFDPRLSASQNLSCATCHNLSLGGADGRPKSLGEHWQAGARNAPTVLNSVFNFVQFWDGRAADLAEQAGGPILNPVEMGSTKPLTVETLKSIPDYVTAFKAAFPGVADPITYDNVGKAIAVFEATLITPQSPFDRWLAGDDKALSDKQKAGLRLFVDKGCSGCHNGINIGGAMYATFGVVKAPSAEVRPPEDLGRGAITKSKDDDYSFKVPSLRNIALTAPYFHSGSVWTLGDAVKIMAETQLGTTLTDAEAASIVDFLNSLTGKQPTVDLPNLPASAAATPRPAP